jgi:6-phosphofructokinase 1
MDATIQFLKQYNISQLYILGGDGTHRGAYQIHETCQSLGLNIIAVVGIPKTIDCDIDYVDRTFGFNTAVETAQAAIRTGLTEAKCTLPNGIAVIKLMGRSAGFLAAFSALGSGGDVDVVLVPEVPIALTGDNGILPFLQKRVQEKQYAVVVVAEGAGQELLTSSSETEAGSGNKKLLPIAEYIRDEIIAYFQEEVGEEVRMKYIDPSYLVRSVPANASDSLYCTQLAMQAVHGAMAGYTGFSVGLVNNQIVYIPIPQLVATSPRAMDPQGVIWERVLAMTGQPSPAVDDVEEQTKTSTESAVPTREEPTSNDHGFPSLPEPAVQ